MAMDAWRTANWLDKFRVLWSRTGWRPGDVEILYPAQKSNLDQFEKYNPDLSLLTNGAIVAQYILLSVFHLSSAGQVAQLSYGLVWATVAIQAYTLVVIGAILDGKPFARRLEQSRLLVLATGLYTSFSLNLITIDWLYFGIGALLLSAAVMWLSLKPTMAPVSSKTELA
jgi:hypothetical protein